MKKRLIIVGAGNVACRLIGDNKLHDLYTVVGCISDSSPSHEFQTSSIVPHLGSTEEICKICEAKEIGCIIIAIGQNLVRKKLYYNTKSIVPFVSFPPYVSPLAYVAQDIVLKDNVLIGPNASIEAGTKLSVGCRVNTNSSVSNCVEFEEFCSVGNNVFIGPYSKIKEGVTISPSSAVAKKITIGKYSMIGIGSVVLEDLQDYSLAYGCPAKTVRQRSPEEIHY